MGKIDYQAIYDSNQDEWKALTRNPQKYEALLAGHYSDSNHFVYELLQNAEDEKASRVVIEYYSDKLVFYHNGEPFDEADVRGVSSMLMGTKDREDAQTIGRFGMGFKSVFKYTYQPEIYSDEEAFKITRYLLPIEITEGWNFESEKQGVVCKLGMGRSTMPFLKSDHLTKIIIPFLKYGKSGELETVPGDDVLKKLNELNGEILLFLSHIKNLYWVNKENGKFAQITLSQDAKDEQLITCRIEGTNYGDKEEISRYLKFKKTFDHEDMDNAEVSIAYKLNSRADNINEVTKSPVWVYFPTRDETKLPFLVHGAFETAVSREKLMAPSSFNSDLFDELGNLIADSMVELAKRKLITQVFLRKIVITSFIDEEENGTILGLKNKVTRAIAENGLLPDRNGKYYKPEDLKLPAPFRMADFKDKPFISNIFQNVNAFVAFNNDQEANFTQYYLWLVNDLGIEIYTMTDMANDIKNLPYDFKIPNSGEVLQALKDFYDFLSDNREALYQTGLSYSRSGPYVQDIRMGISEAWKILRKAPIILNRMNKLVPAEINGKPSIYLASSSEYKSVMQSALVHTSISLSFRTVLSEGFRIQEFNNFQYIKEKVVQKYIDIQEELGFADCDNFTEEYIEDLNQIFALVEQTGKSSEIRDMLKDAYIIKVKPGEGDEGSIFAKPGECYLPKSIEGIDLNIYYHPIPYEDASEEELADESCWYDFDMMPIDSDYYESNGISLKDLMNLGLLCSPVIDGKRTQEGIGDNHWIAVGDYCPEIDILNLEDNLGFIEEYPDDELAQKKSAEILKLALIVAPKLQGKRRFRKNSPYEGPLEESYILSDVICAYSWLYDKDMKNSMPTELSKYDLNPGLYGVLQPDKKAYEILGFIEKEADGAEETLQKAAGLNRQDKMRLLNWLARDLGKQVSDSDLLDDDWENDDPADIFDSDVWQDKEFPVHKVNNFEYLLRHVQEQFYCADPTTYRKVWRQIRVSKDNKADRAYAIGMYTNASNTKICQMCKEPVAFIEVDQIANFGIEMPQLNLCLCRECSAQYRAIRDVNKEDFKNKLKSALLSIDIYEVSNDYSIEFNSDMVLHFTQTHIAEIQEILRLLDEYGTPAENVAQEFEENVAGPLMCPVRKVTEQDVADSDVARAGSFITYKKAFAGNEILDNTLHPDKYPLHKAFIGHKVGDVIVYMGKQYEITAVIN